MANYRRTATGNWSNLAQWEDDGGGSYAASTVLPGPGDVAYANNFTVTLDVDVVVDELRTTTATNINQGGVFLCGAGDTIIANLFAGNSEAVRNSTNNTKTIIGNVVNSLSGQGAAHNQSLGTLNIIGNVFGGSAAGSIGVLNRNGITNITGNCTGGSGGGAYGVWNALFGATGTVIIIGTCTGGTSTDSSGARNDTTGLLRATTAQSSLTSPGVWGQNQNATTVVENLIWSLNGTVPIRDFVKFNNTAPKSAEIILEDNSTLTLVDPATTDIPTETDVRDGVSYASGVLTGTLVVPSDDTVTLGVVYDNGTIGTAQNTAASFLSEISTSPNLLAERLRNVSTVDSTAATVAAFKV
jgi:hypothetical protein